MLQTVMPLLLPICYLTVVSTFLLLIGKCYKWIHLLFAVTGLGYNLYTNWFWALVASVVAFMMFFGLVMVGSKMFKSTTIFSLAVTILISGSSQVLLGIIIGLLLLVAYSLYQMIKVGRVSDWRNNGFLAIMALGLYRRIPLLGGINRDLIPEVDSNSERLQLSPTLYVPPFLLAGMIILAMLMLAST